MNKIFIQKQDSKFINNTILCLEHLGQDIISIDINSDLYRTYHHYSFNSAIFLASKINNEIAQFISEFYTKIKCFIYHDIENHEAISSFGVAVRHFSHLDQSNTVKIPKMINPWLFYQDPTITRKTGSYAVFLEGAKDIPEQLANVLYPNTNLHINLFNSVHFQHPLNLGHISEYDKARILNTYEFFININQQYDAEAVACGAKVINIQDLPKILNSNSKTKRKNKNTIKENIKSYEEFLKEQIL